MWLWWFTSFLGVPVVDFDTVVSRQRKTEIYAMLAKSVGCTCVVWTTDVSTMLYTYYVRRTSFVLGTFHLDENVGGVHCTVGEKEENCARGPAQLCTFERLDSAYDMSAACGPLSWTSPCISAEGFALHPHQCGIRPLLAEQAAKIGDGR